MTLMANSARPEGSGMTVGPVSWKSCRFPTGGTCGTHGSAGLPRSTLLPSASCIAQNQLSSLSAVVLLKIESQNTVLGAKMIGATLAE